MKCLLCVPGTRPIWVPLRTRQTGSQPEGADLDQEAGGDLGLSQEDKDSKPRSLSGLVSREPGNIALPGKLS